MKKTIFPKKVIELPAFTNHKEQSDEEEKWETICLDDDPPASTEATVITAGAGSGDGASTTPLNPTENIKHCPTRRHGSEAERLSESTSPR